MVDALEAQSSPNEGRPMTNLVGRLGCFLSNHKACCLFRLRLHLNSGTPPSSNSQTSLRMSADFIGQPVPKL